MPERYGGSERISVRRDVGAAVAISLGLAYIPGQRGSDTRSVVAVKSAGTKLNSAFVSWPDY